MRIPRRIGRGRKRALTGLLVIAMLLFSPAVASADVPLNSRTVSVPNPVVANDTWMTGQITMYADHVDATLGDQPPLSLDIPVQSALDEQGGLTIQFRVSDDYSARGFQLDWVQLEQPGEPTLFDDFNALDTSLWRVTGHDPTNATRAFDPSLSTQSISNGILALRPTRARGGVFLYTTQRVIKRLPATLTYRVRYPGYTYRTLFTTLYSTSIFDDAGHGWFDWGRPFVHFGPGSTHHGYIDKYLWAQWPDLPPTAEAGPDQAGAMGRAIDFDGVLSADPDGSIAGYLWDFGDGTSATGPTASHAYAAPGVYTVTLTVTDDSGRTATDEAMVTVANLNRPPSLSVLAAGAQALEGGTASNTGIVSDPDGDAVSLAASRGTVTNNGDGTFAWSMQTGDTSDAGPVTISATDGQGGTASVTFDVAVENVAPTVTVVGPSAAIMKGGTANIAASIADPGTSDAFTASIDWGDGTSSDGIVSGAAVSGSHVYEKAGIYDVKIAVTDKDGGSGEAAFSSVVVYDPSAGFVTGGGRLAPPAGSMAWKPKLSPTATFGFDVKYDKSRSVPRGSVEFQLHKGIKFKSESVEWLVVDGRDAIFEGRGKINRRGDYGFAVSVTDGKGKGHDSDCLRMRIWDYKTGQVVYDTEPGADPWAPPTTPLKGGSIVVHK